MSVYIINVGLERKSVGNVLPYLGSGLAAGGTHVLAAADLRLFLTHFFSVCLPVVVAGGHNNIGFQLR